uniref:Glucan endo-1,3-beta-D-glucosidase n=1 Tax=Leersia perrieri TaxID=77586 RepID=A0A0D9VA52_9ORYZ
MKALSNFAFSFANISVMMGVTTTYNTGLRYGGPVSMTLGWLVVAVFNGCVALSMAEICSAYPTSGGLYYWSAKLAGKEWASLASWVTGWFNIVGQQWAAIASVDFSLAQLLQVIILLSTGGANCGGYMASKYTVLAIYAFILILHGIINSLPIELLSLFGHVGAIWNAAVAKDKPSVEFVFTHLNTENGMGIHDKAYILAVGLLMSQYSVIGYDTSAHMVEETKNADRSGPTGIITSVVFATVFGWIYLLALTSVVTDIPYLLSPSNDAGGYAIAQALYTAFHRRYGTGVGGVVCLGAVAVAVFLCGIATVTSNSRVNKHEVPINVVWLGVAVAFLIALMSLGSQVAFQAMGSTATLGMYIAYALPVFFRVTTARKSFVPGPFHLGKYGVLVGWVGVVWVGTVTVLFSLPVAYPVANKETFNYTPVAVGGVLLLSAGVWVARARFWFQGPITNSPLPPPVPTATAAGFLPKNARPVRRRRRLGQPPTIWAPAKHPLNPHFTWRPPPHTPFPLSDGRRRRLLRRPSRVRSAAFMRGLLASCALLRRSAANAHLSGAGCCNGAPSVPSPLRRFPPQLDYETDPPLDGVKVLEKESTLNVAVSQLASDFDRESNLCLDRFSRTRRTPIISTGSLKLDIALGIGGLPKGRMVELFGKEASGKTTLALHVVKEAQKKGGCCAYIDAENAFNPSVAEAIGVNVEKLLITQPDSAENSLSIVNTLVGGSIDVVVIDSVAALIPRCELEGEIYMNSEDVQSRLMTRALRKIQHTLSRSETLIIFVNQVRTKLSSNQLPGIFKEVACGGNALGFYAAVRMRTSRRELRYNEDQATGIGISVQIIKNKLSPATLKEASIDIRFGKGICYESEILELASSLGVILKDGCGYWINGDFLADKAEAEKFLRENAVVADEICGTMRSQFFERCTLQLHPCATGLGVQSIGVCYGVIGDGLRSASEVVNLYKSNGITSMRIYFADGDALDALRNSGIALALDVGTRDDVARLAADPSNAVSWVNDNVKTYHPDVNFRYIVVGNELTGDTNVLPAMQNVHAALTNAGLAGEIKVSTAIKMDTIASSSPPSSAVFTNPSVMEPIVKFLAGNGSPLLANVYPYFAYKDSDEIELGFALFEPSSTTVNDPNGLSYTNLFDAMVDAVRAAVEKVDGGGGVDVVVSETGWPSADGKGATVENARVYNQNLIGHVGQGTPKKPGQLETYVFAMFNENRKEGDPTEKKFGLFNPDMTPPGFPLAVAAALLLGVFISIPVGVQSVGVCYGMIGNNLPSKSDVVQLYKSNGITDMRIYLPDAGAMSALRGSGIGLIVGVANENLIQLAADPAAAVSWVNTNIKPFIPSVNIKYIAVGNEITGEPTQNILPAMQHINAALVAAGLATIKVSTAVRLDVVTNTFPPSAGVFAQPYMTAVAQFLASTGSPLLANVYPYFAYVSNKKDISLAYATFQPGTKVTDPGTGFVYTNLFDAMVDAVHAALDKAGARNVRVVVSESGWPSAGGDSATVGNARTYVQNLINHVKIGTPRRPGQLETYVFAMFNENQKPGQLTERNFGLFFPNKTPVYPIKTMARRQGVASMLTVALIVVAIFASVPTAVQSIGVCYGMLGNNLPSKNDVVQLYRSKGINGMRIYYPDRDTLNALRSSGNGIGLILDIGGTDQLSYLAASRSNADAWVRDNIRPYYPSVNIKYIAVGNEVEGGATNNILPAIRNVNAALAAAGFGNIKASTSVKYDVISNSYPPSAGVFRDNYMRDIARYLASTNAPLLANVYPYFAYRGNPRDISLNYATFRPGTTVRDPNNGLTYTNLFDAMMDAIYAALEKAGAGGVKVVVSESGWPSAEGFGASIDNARAYNQGLIDHVGRGTPKRPGALETYIFAMFNENQKTGDPTERNFGLFYPNKAPVYPIRGVASCSMLDMASASSMLDWVLLLSVFASIVARTAAVGVCWGMSGDNLPPASKVVDMLHENGFTIVRLYAPDTAALAALGGTGIRVVVGAPNYDLPALANGGVVAAAAWVRANIQSHPTVTFRYVVVGNEVSGDDTRLLVPAMENVHAALALAGLGHIKVTTSISQATIAVHIPPSAGEFTDEAKSFMSYVIPFLERTHAPLLANLYPYFIYSYNPGGMDLSFMLFTASGNNVVMDGEYVYENQFDATVDAVYTAVAKMGGTSVRVVVSETGWPTAGGVAASVENARTFNQNLVRHVRKGTPRRPWRKTETYVFAMFNENQKEAGVEQNWGLFFPNTDMVYPISFHARV